jgi:hypothetical protein
MKTFSTPAKPSHIPLDLIRNALSHIADEVLELTIVEMDAEHYDLKLNQLLRNIKNLNDQVNPE